VANFNIALFKKNYSEEELTKESRNHILELVWVFRGKPEVLQVEAKHAHVCKISPSLSLQ
jgi:hypothetical protein